MGDRSYYFYCSLINFQIQPLGFLKFDVVIVLFLGQKKKKKKLFWEICFGNVDPQTKLWYSLLEKKLNGV